MRIEEGKYYRTRDGRKVGPMSRCGVGPWPWGVDGDCEHWNDFCREDGTTYMGESRIERHNDLVAEWAEPVGPIRTETVTTRRLEPGVYGLLYVGSEVEGHPTKEVLVRIAPDHGPAMCAGASELRELARVALEIAGYLDAQ